MPRSQVMPLDPGALAGDAGRDYPQDKCVHQLFEEQLAISRREGSEPSPLSFAQQRLWFLDRLEPGSHVYNIPMPICLRGHLDVGALQKALDAIVQRHWALRTRFLDVNGTPQQVVGDDSRVMLSSVDLCEVSEPERRAEARRLMEDEARRPFDLSRDPVLRASLIRISGDEHIFLLVIHHIAFDGWSMGVLYREIQEIYRANLEGRPASLPELPIQYVDYARWQREWLQGEPLETQLAYWKGQLGGVLPALELPVDRPRPAVQTYRGANQSLDISETLTQGVRALGRREGVTVFTTLLAVFDTLLHRYTGQEDIIIGSHVAGRNRVQTEALIGFFVNTVVLRTDLSGNPTFGELVGRVREVALGAQGHQDLPFEKLVEELHAERSLSRNPLFQVMFILQNAPMHTADLPGLSWTPLEVDTGTARVDLTLLVTEEAEGMVCRFEYNTDIFDAATIGRMKGHFQTLLEGILAGPGLRLSDLPILTASERHQLLVEWNDTGRDYPRDKCAHQEFEEQVERTPDAVAVVFEGQKLTYRDLNRRANQLAQYLRRMGVGPEVRVGLCVERSLEMLVGLLGILKAGGANVPLDPTYPRERLAFLLEDTQVPVLLTQERLVGNLPQHTASVICLDSGWEPIARESEENPDTSVTPQNLIHVIYTSGSTGRPKGVQIPHGALTNFCHSIVTQMGITGRDVFLAHSTPSFDMAVFELVLPLTTGASLVVVNRETSRDVERLSAKLTESRATVMISTPSLWNQLLNTGWQSSSQLTILCGGEALSRELAAQLLERCSDLWNVYGPTETTVWSVAVRVGPGSHPVPIGRPIDNTQIYLLDQHAAPVPVGVVGEVYIGGAGLARGYLNRPELTAERFVPNPFGDQPGDRLYRTGDLARYLPDGNIEFLGRIDNQIKIRGFRVEPGEIETLLRELPGVREAAVIAQEHTLGEKRLVAYVVPNDRQTPQASELRAFLKERLPEYMIPAAYVQLEALPLTPNGKVDRRALPAADDVRPSTGTRFVAPRDALETQLTEIWEAVLGVGPIGVNDDFFALGGHSLLAVQLVTLMNKVLVRQVPVAVLFEAPTVELLADAIRQEGDPGRRSSLVAIQSEGSKPPLFCVHGVGGGLFWYRDLRQYLGADQRLFGLRAPGLYEDRAVHTRLEEMAAHYVTELQLVQPRGPYYLAGFCFGGLVALELAQALRARGEKVALLVLFETSKPKSRTDMLVSQVDNVGVHLNNLLQLGPKEEIPYLRSRLAALSDRITKGIRGISAGSGPFATVREQGSRRMDGPAYSGIEEANRLALESYVPQPYEGRVVLFLAEDEPLSRFYYRFRSRLPWRKLLVGELEIDMCPGDHLTMMLEPHVRVLAEKLKARLSDAEGQS